MISSMFSFTDLMVKKRNKRNVSPTDKGEENAQ